MSTDYLGQPICQICGGVGIWSCICLDPTDRGMTCGCKTPHLPHDYDEDLHEGIRRSWSVCVGMNNSTHHSQR